MVTYTLPLDRDRFEVLRYKTRDGRRPFNEWMKTLREAKVISAIDARIERLYDGNFGDHRFVGEGVWEIRMHLGQGYRVYYLLDGLRAVVLLCGGQKGSQIRDMTNAKVYAADYWRRK